MDAYRHPPAPPPVDPEVAAAEARMLSSFARKRRTMAVLVGIVALACTSPALVCSYHLVDNQRQAARWRQAQELTPSERAEIAELLPRARAAIDESAAAWRAATADAALSRLQASTRACPYAYSAPTETAAASYVRYASIDGNYFGAGYTTSTAGAPRSSSSLQAADDLLTPARVGSMSRHDLQSLRGVADGTYFTREVLVVADESSAARMDGDSYLSGRVLGRAYVYDFHQRAIVCVADLDAQSSEHLDFEYWSTGSMNDFERTQAANAALARDLEVQVRRAIAEGLRAAIEGEPHVVVAE
jgi:hypothetical protein